MMALAELGVEIGPLIAGASVVGVAIGFGAQMSDQRPPGRRSDPVGGAGSRWVPKTAFFMSPGDFGYPEHLDMEGGSS
jgi:hypothetical protein